LQYKSSYFNIYIERNFGYGFFRKKINRRQITRLEPRENKFNTRARFITGFIKIKKDFDSAVRAALENLDCYILETLVYGHKKELAEKLFEVPIVNGFVESIELFSENQ